MSKVSRHILSEGEVEVTYILSHKGIKFFHPTKDGQSIKVESYIPVGKYRLILEKIYP